MRRGWLRSSATGMRKRSGPGPSAPDHSRASGQGRTAVSGPREAVGVVVVVMAGALARVGHEGRAAEIRQYEGASSPISRRRSA